MGFIFWNFSLILICFILCSGQWLRNLQILCLSLSSGISINHMPWCEQQKSSLVTEYISSLHQLSFCLLSYNSILLYTHLPLYVQAVTLYTMKFLLPNCHFFTWLKQIRSEVIFFLSFFYFLSGGLQLLYRS